MSPPTPTSPVTPPSPTLAAAATRPDWLPHDDFWDKDKSELKGADLGKKFNEMAARIAADDVRKGTLPQTPDAYKLELPTDFKPPAGIEFKFDETDPLLGQARSVMHDIDQGKLSGQQAFSKLLALYAGANVADASRIKAAATAEIGKLGATASSRVDAVTRFMDSQGLGVLKSTMVTAAQVEAWESHITKITNGGSSGFTPQHRDHQPQGKVSAEEFAKMSPAARLDYARQFPQPKVA